MTTEILVVDDSAELARQAAELITVGVQLAAMYASDSQSAREIVEQHPIAVVVLDQRMGADLPGTELFVVLKKLRPNLRAIMLTGEADADEVGAALSAGFHEYLPKGRIAELPDRVRLHYLKHRAERVAGGTENPDTLLWPRRGRLRLLRHDEIRLLAVTVVEPRFVDPADWMTIIQLNAGEERKLSRQVARNVSLVLEEQSQRSLQATLRLAPRALDAVTAALQSTLTHSLKKTRTISDTVTDSSEQVFKLPAEPDAAGEVYVRARLFQRAPIQRKVLVTLAVSCRCCGLRNVIPLVVFQDTDLFTTRHEDRMSDGTVKLIETGDVS
jgi:DNA-binding response OmpR family regulator